jgi:hypothetical protein
MLGCWPTPYSVRTTDNIVVTPVRYERAINKDPNVRSAADLGFRVDALRTEWVSLAWMESSEHPPKQQNSDLLPGGGKLGTYWKNCKNNRRCGRAPHNRLLVNPILRADYERTINRQPSAVICGMKVDALRTEWSILEWVEDREQPPRQDDATELPGGSRLGIFWRNCKSERKCAR